MNDILFATTAKIIKANLQNSKLNTKIIAEQVHYTSDYIGRIIKLHTGMTFFKYVGNLRVEQAKQLLKTNTVRHTAELMGYQTHDGFGAMFKRYTGVTPIEYKHGI